MEVTPTKRKGFMLVEALVACFISSLLLSAILSSLYLASALVFGSEAAVNRERTKREKLLEATSSVTNIQESTGQWRE